MSKYGGSNFQLPVGGYLPSAGNVQGGLQTDYQGANQLWGISQPSPAYGKNKQGKRVQTGLNWNPLALQSQMHDYKQAVNQGTTEINAFTPRAMQAAQDAQNMGVTAADMASGAVPGLYNLGGMMTGMAPGLFGQAGAVDQQAGNVMQSQLAQIPGLQGYANAALQMGFDPQNALFNRTAQQMRDVLGASGEAAGVGGSPYGANLQSQGMENFLLDWQNQQLGRQQTAAGTAGSLYNTIGGLTAPGESLYNIGQGLYGTGQNLASGGAGLDQAALGLGQGASQLADTAGKMPIQMAEDIATGKLGLQDALTQAKSNMYNQRTGGFNAMNQYLGTAENMINSMIGAMKENLGASQQGLTNELGFAGAALKMMGKGGM